MGCRVKQRKRERTEQEGITRGNTVKGRDKKEKDENEVEGRGKEERRKSVKAK